MRLDTIFTPNDQPTITYVDRSHRDLEKTLRSALLTPKMVTSLSGPSKTGKTVLLKSVIDEEQLIYLRGAYIKSLDDFFKAILSWFEAPSEIVTSVTASTSANLGAQAGSDFNIGFAKGKGALEGGAEFSKSSTEGKTFGLNPFDQIVKEISFSDFAIFLDDYHYMPREVQEDVAKVIKSLAEAGVRVCTALVPHRAEDVLKANPELKGRLISIEIPEWDTEELRLISTRGFAALNAKLDDRISQRLAAEAMGSPQLMQVLCLNLCQQLNLQTIVIEEPQELNVSEEVFAQTLKMSANFASSSELVQALHSGPKVKGTPRTQYELTDGTRGDVYRALLLAVTSDPITRDFSYDEIYQRVRRVCRREVPTGQSISQSLKHMCNIASQQSQGRMILEWDDANLHIADPYLAFYMRASSKIEQLGKSGFEKKT